MHATWEDNFDPAADTATPEQQTLNTEEMTELREAIMQLSEREQRILEMTYWLDMKSGEVAKALGMTPDNVRHVLMEARKKLLMEKALEMRLAGRSCGCYCRRKKINFF